MQSLLYYFLGIATRRILSHYYIYLPSLNIAIRRGLLPNCIYKSLSALRPDEEICIITLIPLPLGIIRASALIHALRIFFQWLFLTGHLRPFIIHMSVGQCVSYIQTYSYYDKQVFYRAIPRYTALQMYLLIILLNHCESLLLFLGIASIL